MIRTMGTVDAIRVVDRVAVRGRIGEPSHMISGWTRGRYVAELSVDGTIVNVDLTDAQAADILSRMSAGQVVRCNVTVEVVT